MSAAWVAGAGPSLQRRRTCHSRPNEPRVWRKETGLASSLLEAGSPPVWAEVGRWGRRGGCSLGRLRAEDHMGA